MVGSIVTMLQAIKDALESIQGLSVSERGTGNGTFLFLKTRTRAAEVYMESVGYVVECWDSADEEADDPPVSRDVVGSENEAVAKLKHWLLPG